MTIDGRAQRCRLPDRDAEVGSRPDGRGASGSGSAKVITFHPKRLPMARLVDVQEAVRTAMTACPICEGDRTLPVISKAGERVKDVDCPHCGGVGHVA